VRRVKEEADRLATTGWRARSRLPPGVDHHGYTCNFSAATRRGWIVERYVAGLRAGFAPKSILATISSKVDCAGGETHCLLPGSIPLLYARNAKMMNRRDLLSSVALASMAVSAVEPGPAQAQTSATRPGFFGAKDIAEAGFIYGLPIVMNYAVMYEYSVDRNSGQFKAPFNQLKNEPNVFTYKGAGSKNA
jgi:hypothetical protein